MRTLVSKAQSRPGGIAWNDVTDIIAGSSGIALALLSLGSMWRDESLLAAARDGVRHLATRGVATTGGLRWAMTDQFPRRMPNFSHGTAGVAYTLATIGAAVQERTLVDAARAGARYLDAIATPVGTDGRRIFHSEPGNEQLFYLSWCHGPVGTARLYHRLHTIDRASAHRDTADRLARGVIASGVPDRSAGFWQNVSQCCGNGGVVEHFIDRARAYADPSALAYAERVMDDALTRATGGADHLSFPQAENRTQPENIQAQTGFMQGAAGMIVALLHLDGARERRAPSIILPDSPYGA
jgi:lantibiotic modifying enzyme